MVSVTCREQNLTTATATEAKSLREGYEPYPGRRILITTASQGDGNCKLPFSSGFGADELYDLVSNFKKQGYSVCLDGVEPLSAPGYLRAFELAEQKTVITNGLSICENSQYIYDIRDAGIETVGVFYHFDIHSRLSKIYLRLAETALDIAKNAFLNTCVVTAMTRPYLDKIPEYCAWCVKKGYNEIRFMNFMGRGWDKNTKDELVLSPDDRRSYYEIISSERKKYPKDILRITSRGSFEACGTPHMGCMAIRDSIVLAPNYMAYPCYYMIESGKECGFYRDGRIFTKKGVVVPFRGDCVALHLHND